MMRTSFGDILAPGFREIFFQNYTYEQTGVEQIFKVSTSKL